jgi:hypothetical protein
MIAPVKLVVCFLKSVKPLPSVQNDYPVMNTSGSLYSPVMNIPGSLDSPVMYTLGSLGSPVVNTLGSIGSPVMNTPGSQLLGVFGSNIKTVQQKNFLVTNRPRSKDLVY